MPTKQTNGNGSDAEPIDLPDIEISIRQMFGIDTDMVAPAFSVTTELVPNLKIWSPAW